MDNHRLTGIVQSGGTNGYAPLAEARVTLYDATEGAPKVIASATTDWTGWFEADHDADPTADGIFYATASLPGGIVLATIIGQEIRGAIVINELTTVAAAFALAQFIAQNGTIAGSTFGLRVAAGMSDNLVSPLTGGSSDVMLASPNADETNSLRSTRALANLLSPTARGFQGAWDTLRQLTTPPGSQPPADTFQAMVNIARNPANNVDEIYQQAQVLDDFLPTLQSAPDAWTLAVKVNRTGDDGVRMFGGPANISWDRNGYAWVANNVFQGTPNSGDFVVVLKPNGMPSDGQNGTPRSPVVGGGMVGPGFGVSVGPDGNVWVGSFGWGPSSSFPPAGIVSAFDASGNPVPGGICFQGLERVQGTVADAQNNLWLASYETNTVVVYPGGNPNLWFSYPPQGSTQAAPGTGTFGIAVREAEPGTAWVTYSAGLGWPTANPSHVARFRIANGALECTLTRQAGAAVKGIALDGHGNAWIASGGDDSVYVVTPEGQVTGFTDRGGLSGPWGVAVDGDDDVWVANFGPMGAEADYTAAGISKLAGAGSPSGLPVGEALTPPTGYTLKSAGSPVLLPDGSPVYKDGTDCFSPLMRMTSVTLDAAGNIWAVNNWKPRFGTDFEPNTGNPGGDGIVIFVGLARPPRTAG
jgi:hypothetical protein